MAVYVDSPRNGWSHMVADSREELLAMADRIGMRREWFQNHRHWHFDVKATKRALAVKYGAVEVSAREAARISRAQDVTDD